MKRIAILIFLCLLALLNADGQLTLSLGSDSDDGMVGRLYSYISANAGNWSFLNTTQIKYSEVQDNIASYYQESIARNFLHAWQIKENWALDLYLGLGISPEDDHLTEIPGIKGLYQYNNSLSLGGNYNYDNSRLYFDLKTDYISTAYDKHGARQQADNSIRENDLLWEIAAGYWLTQDLLFTVNGDHFNDLNENESFNYSCYYLQGEYEHRLNYIHFLTQNVQIGYSDLDDELTNYIRTYTRLSSKFAQDWTLLNIIVWQGWLDEEMSEIFLGNSWYETNIRRNFNVSDNNQLSYAQMGALYEFDSEVMAFNTSAKYYLNNLKFYASGRYFLGDERWLDYEMTAGTGWEFIDYRFNIGYQFGITQDFDGTQANMHQLLLEYYF
ncbi:MAG: hypothetical protein K9M99_08280 [Candidatus Cloacimonetes bacterium]|nr:hypothetical protein [Candidatus Cloacimonadota bacterium]